MLPLLPKDPVEHADLIASYAVKMSLACYGNESREHRFRELPNGWRSEDQGAINSCAANAVSGAMEALHWMQTKAFGAQLSRWFPYAGRRTDNGRTLAEIVRRTRELGIPREDLVPYPRSFREGQFTFSHAVLDDAATRKLSGVVEVDTYDDWRAVLGGLVGPIYIGSFWPLSIRNGVAAAPPPTTGGGHAYFAICLADTADSRGRPHIWCANSHANLPAFKVTADWVSALMARDYFGTVGLTDMSQPKPRNPGWLKAVVA